MPIFSSFSSSPARALGTTSASKPGRAFNIIGSDIGSGRAFNNGAVSVAFEHKGVRADFFTVTSSGNHTATGNSSPIIVEGLDSNTSYTFTVTATNSIGTSKVSDNSAAVTATTVPQAPTLSSVSSNGNRTSIVSTFTAGANGGKNVSTFTSTRSGPASQNGASSPITLTGLTAGTSYSVAVTATNDNGTSLPSNEISATTFDATGGTITNVGGYVIHRFTGNDSFVPNQSKSVEYLVVAGGGSGGGPNTNFGGQGGGGGAGGVLSGTTTLSATSHSITVGNGGAYHPNNGQNSSIGSTVVATGGGHGGRGDNVYGPGSGGSGGGRARGNAGAGGSGIAGQGFAGGSNANLSWGHGAGGGAGGVGANGGGDLSSASGGASITSSITGSNVEYARGGNGGSRDGGGTTHLGVNTGAGGGGGAAGRSGVIVIRYLET